MRKCEICFKYVIIRIYKKKNNTEVTLHFLRLYTCIHKIKSCTAQGQNVSFSFMFILYIIFRICIYGNINIHIKKPKNNPKHK